MSIPPLRERQAYQALAEPELGHDSSTNSLIRRYRALKGKESEHDD